MNKDIKDYLHLYLGCEVELDNGGSKVVKKLIAVGGVDDGDYQYCKLRKGSAEKGHVHAVMLKENRVKPILRPLSDMTEEEKKDVVLINYNVSATFKEAWIEEGGVLGFITSGLTGGGRIDLFASNPETFLYLLSHHFDLFGLIESGLAINKNDIK